LLKVALNTIKQTNIKDHLLWNPLAKWTENW
jgi:hypothetical protein